jgi:hypothetical protein
MTNIRSGGGPRIAPVQAQAPVAPQKVVVPQAKAPEAVVARHVITQDDRHGAAARAFDNPAAQQLKARVTGNRQDAWGFGQNDGERPLRTMAGSPAATAWQNPGNGVLANVTAFPPTGKLDVGACYANLGAACVLGAAVLSGPTRAADVMVAVAKHDGANLLAPARQELLDIARATQECGVEYHRLNRAQALCSLAANLTSGIKEAIQQASRPPLVNRLTKEHREQLKVYDRFLSQGKVLDEVQVATLSTVLHQAHLKEMPVVRAWDPNIAAPKVARDLRIRWVTAEGPGPELDDVGTLATLAGVLGGPPSALPLPKEGVTYKFLTELITGMANAVAAVLRVHLSDKVEDAASDHLVVLGRRPDGVAYLYNPDPRSGDYTLMFGRAGKNQAPDFLAQVQNYAGRIRPDVDGVLPTWTMLRLG